MERMSVLLVKQRISVSGGRLSAFQRPEDESHTLVCDSSSGRWKADSRLSTGYN